MSDESSKLCGSQVYGAEDDGYDEEDGVRDEKDERVEQSLEQLIVLVFFILLFDNRVLQSNREPLDVV